MRRGLERNLGSGAHVIIQVSGKLISFPRTCACCCNPADTEVGISASRSRGKRVVRVESATWRVPYCSPCKAHASLWASGTGCISGGLAAGTLLGLLFLFVAPAAVAGVIWIACFAIGVALSVARRKEARKGTSRACACFGDAASFNGWSGTVQTFDFASRDYAALFMDANAGKLVSLSGEARRLHDELLERKRLELEAVAAQAHAMAEARLREARAAREQAEIHLAQATEAHNFERSISKLEAARGPAGRRAALEGGLRLLTQQHNRERLVLEASRIEVQAALDKADGQKTAAAKVRTLQAALDAIRADEVPDELQEQQIRWLEDAIAQVHDVRPE